VWPAGKIGTRSPGSGSRCPSRRAPRWRPGKTRIFGNRFDLVLRNVVPDPETAVERARRKLEHLSAQGGLENLYGAQRFGHEGRNLDRGLDVLAAGRLRRGETFVASAAQSALFNLYVLERRARGLLRTALVGDLLRRTDSGGLFVVEDPAIEQPRMDRGELVVTGPIFGARMRWPGDGPAKELEEEILGRAGLDASALVSFGKRLPGSRRPALVDPTPVTLAPEPSFEGLGPGIRLGFTLPAGSYATQLLRELQGPCDRTEDPP
jgi:tRNA pseudouridine13 synthase